MSGINGIGSNPISSVAETFSAENTSATTHSSGGSPIGNVVSSFSEVVNNVGGGIGDLFSSLGSSFGGGKSNSPNGFDLGSIIGAIFDNPIFKLFEGLLGGGKKLDPISVAPPQGQAIAQDASGSLYAERSGVSAEEESSDGFDANAAVGNGLPLSAIDDIDDTPSSEPVSNVAHLEDDK